MFFICSFQANDKKTTLFDIVNRKNGESRPCLKRVLARACTPCWPAWARRYGKMRTYAYLCVRFPQDLP
jgi:hypothetical protein